MLKYLSSNCNTSWKNITYPIIIIAIFLLLICTGLLFKNFNYIKQELERCKNAG